MKQNKIAHIINPVHELTNKALHQSQSITIKSIINSLTYTYKHNNNKNITVYALSFADEEEHNLPLPIQNLAILHRSVLDIHNFKNKRKLPLLADLLIPPNNLISYYDYVIYTNIDICVMPHFYDHIEHLIYNGYDSIAINRRTLSNKYTQNPILTTMYSDLGQNHEGIDCFVIKTDTLRKAKFFSSFIGSGPVGLCFVVNMISNSNNFIWIENEHLTFHIGDDKSWYNDMFKDYQIQNFKELIKICDSHLSSSNSQNLTKSSKYIVSEIKIFSQYQIARLRTDKRKYYSSSKPKDLIRLFSNHEYAKIDQKIRFKKFYKYKNSFKHILSLLIN